MQKQHVEDSAHVLKHKLTCYYLSTASHPVVAGRDTDVGILPDLRCHIKNEHKLIPLF